MKKTCVVLPCLILLGSALCGYGQGTAFTYQGRLGDGASAAQGIYDLRFTIYDAVGGGSQVSRILTNAATVVSNGLFAVTLDFGPGIFSGADRWLEIGVRTNGSAGAFTMLIPRQPITATPYAIFSGASGSLSNGVIQNPQFLGTTGNTPLELLAGNQRALRIEPNTNGAPNVIAGSSVNQVDAGVLGATIAGGGASNLDEGASYSNRVSAAFGTVGGGVANSAGAFGAVVAGGIFNLARGDVSVVSGGYQNSVMAAQYAVIGGGLFNVIQTNAQSSFIGSGSGNVLEVDAAFSSIVGGEANRNNSPHAVIGGGQNNVIEPFAGFSVIGGGLLNVVQSGADQSVVAGGNANKIQQGARESFVGGGFDNVIQTNAGNSFIGGGANNSIRPGAFLASIAGGSGNTISNNAQNATIGGGLGNTVTFSYATVGGGYQNFASGNFNGAGDSATVAGGYQNAAVGNNAVVAGGYANYARGDNSTIAGGWLHTNLTGFGTIGGGQQQLIEPFARFSVIAGGDNNTIRSNSTHGVIAGGQFNSVGTNATYATVAGGFSNQVSGSYGLAAGRRAKANHTGSFVWADSTDADFTSTANNQFNVRANGGIRFETGAGGATLNGQPILSGTVADVQLSPNVALLSANQTFTGQNGFSGSIVMTDPSKSIQFPETSGANAPMVYMFGTGTANSPRMVLAHSPDFPSYGLQYDDFPDRFNFLSAGSPVLTVSLGNLRVGVGTNAPTEKLHVIGNILASGTITPNSDRNAKTGFAPVDTASVLERVAKLDIQQWRFKTEAENVKHVGPMAQDFRAAFGLGTHETAIATVDADGVALAAIQGLHQMVKEKDAKIAALEERLGKVERLLSQMASADK